MENSPSRRTFLEGVVAFLSVGVAAFMSLPVIRFITGSFKERPEQEWYDVLDISEIPAEGVAQVQYNKFRTDGWTTTVVQETVFVSKTREGTFLVFDPLCTHLGCAVSWNLEARQFQCPCHGGKYDSRGIRIAGPPPRPLRQYQAIVKNNILKIGPLKS